MSPFLVFNSGITRQLSHNITRQTISWSISRKCHGDTSGLKEWKVLRMAHVAVATPDVTKASLLYKKLFRLPVSDVHPAPDHRVNTVMVDAGNALVELLDAKGYGEQSPINKFLERSKKGGIHHICFEVDNIKAALDDLTSNGIRSLDPEPRIGARGNPVAFLHPSDCNGVLIELEEAD